MSYRHWARNQRHPYGAKRCQAAVASLLLMVAVTLVVVPTHALAESPQGTSDIQGTDQSENQEYTVIFDGNGGTIGENGSIPQSSTLERKGAVGSHITLDFNVINGDKEFIGWSSDKNNPTEIIKYSYTINGNATLYAIWGDKVTITFDGNGGKFLNGEQSVTDTFVAGTILNTEYKPIKQGYLFVGWSENQNPTASDIVYSKEGDYLKSYTVKQDNITLYAVWERGIDVVFHPNGGYFEDNKSYEDRHIAFKKDDRVYYDTSLKHSAKQIVGWALRDDATPDEIIKNGSIKAAEGLELYAVWSDPVTITFDAGEDGEFYHNGQTERQKQQVYGVGDTILTYRTPVPRSDNKEFEGWALTADAKLEDAVCDLHSVYGYKVEKPVTLYAIWSDTTDITFDLNGGHLSNGYKTTSVKYAIGDTLDGRTTTWLPVDNQYEWAVQNEGYVLVGWSRQKSINSRDDLVIEVSDYRKKYKVTAPDTLYAIWESPKAIIFDANDGLFNSNRKKEITIDAAVGDSISRIDNLDARNNYKFDAWRLEGTDRYYRLTYSDDGYALRDVINNEKYIVSDDNGSKRFTAVWKPIIAGDGSPYAYIQQEHMNGVTIVGYLEDQVVRDDHTLYASAVQTRTLEIPRNIGATGVAGVGDNAFQGDVRINVVTMPDGITSVGDYAFESCANIADIYVPSSVKTFGKSCFGNLSPSCKIHVTPEQAKILNTGERYSGAQLVISSDDQHANPSPEPAPEPAPVPDAPDRSSQGNHSTMPDTPDMPSADCHDTDGTTNGNQGSESSSESSTVMYRLYNPYSGEHLFTANKAEYDSLGTIGWQQEGEAWKSPSQSSTPVYRLYNPYSGDHFYTKDRAEYDRLGVIGWNQEDIAFYSADGGRPIYRLYNPYATVGTHLFTTNADEYSSLPSIGWRAEGEAFYGIA